MRFAFDVGHLHYVVEFTEQDEFLLHVDAVQSDKVVYQMSSFERGFWDEPPDAVWTTTGAGHVFEVKRHVEDFIDKVLRLYQPFYFAFSANETAKVSVYRRFARRLCRRYGYDLAVTNGGTTFRFTLTTDSSQVDLTGRRSPPL